MKYLGPPFSIGDLVTWLCWRDKQSGFPRVVRGRVAHVDPSKSMHGPPLTVDVLDEFDGAYQREYLLPGLHCVSHVSAVDALARLGRTVPEP